MTTSESMAMGDQAFWSLIEKSRQFSQGNQEQQAEGLNEALSDLSEDELIAFDKAYNKYIDQAYHWDLWAAAYIINGGCSDDCFDYFRDWLIAQGQTVYANALQNPETLIDVAQPYEAEFEEFRYVVQEVFEKKFNKEMPYEVRENPLEIQGNEWDEDTVESKYPALAEWVNNPATATSDSVQIKKQSFWNRLFGKKDE